jgi:hypothetical protein
MSVRQWYMLLLWVFDVQKRTDKWTSGRPLIESLFADSHKLTIKQCTKIRLLAHLSQIFI